MTTIGLRSVDFSYDRFNPLFRDLSLQLSSGPAKDRQGHVYAVMGVSGSGKTTLFRLITGSVRPARGLIDVEAGGERVVFSYLPQRAVLFEHLSRMDNARYFARLRSTNARFDGELFERMISQLRLRDALNSDRPVSLMSGGEMQRLSLLRAISIRPHVMLLDEPCTGLDVPVRDDFLIALRELADVYGLLILYITHHADEAVLVADRIIFLLRDLAGVTIIEDTLDAFLLSPPSPTAAQMIAEGPMSIVTCEVVTPGTLSWYDVKVRFDSDVNVSPGEYRLAVPAASVCWSDSGVPAQLMGESGRYAFVSPSNDASVRLVALRSRAPRPAVCLTGDALLFSTSGVGRGIRARLFSTEEHE
jgi:sulfate transport system ATP-binding protein/sulfonate transport system ATP-binding protein